MPKKINPMLLKSKAVVIVHQWMLSWGIDVRLPLAPEEGDLVVEGKRVAVAETQQESADITLSPAALLGRNVKTSLAELHKLTEFVGKGRPEGFRPGATGMERASSDDYLALSMRLTAFARTPNIPEAEIRKWKPVLKREAERAGRRCAKILEKMAMDWHDLESIGYVFLVNYLARNQHLTNDKQNGANLTLNFVQEFGRWADVTVRYLRNVAPITAGLPLDMLVGTPCENGVVDRVAEQRTVEAEGVSRHSFETIPAYTFDLEAPQPEKAELEPVHQTAAEAARWDRQKAMKQGRYLAKRARNAKAALETALAEMPHDRLVQTLNAVVESEFQDPEAREEADRRLYEHQKACPHCEKPAPRRGDDEYAAVHAALVAAGQVTPRKERSKLTYVAQQPEPAVEAHQATL